MVLRSAIVSLAEAVILVLLIVDRVLEPAWEGPALVVARGAIVVAAVVVAGLAYHSWSSIEPRSGSLTVAMVGGLVGGAAITASIVGAPAGVLFGSLPLALLGLLGVVAGAVGMRIDARARTAPS
ncbi:hypothetical protein GCM10009821_22800 [Aeromicrobium halocynthiae]|uniref:Integral membrane protein n=1 Tax=Aeromicrobium halocynthiae TaxID=560557 RepID=A0ABN2W3D6_9ACTN